MNYPVSTTEKRLYLVETAAPFERLDIQFMPEVLRWERRADIPALAVVGRNHPFYQLTGGEDNISFRVDFYAENEDRSDVLRRVRWLHSLLMNNGYRGAVRNVRLVWGDMFQNEVWVLRRADADLRQFMPNAGMMPQQAYVDISLSLDPKKNLTWQDVRR